MIINSVLTVLRLSLLFLNHLQTLEKAGIISSFNSCDVLLYVNLYHQRTWCYWPPERKLGDHSYR